MNIWLIIWLIVWLIIWFKIDLHLVKIENHLLLSHKIEILFNSMQSDRGMGRLKSTQQMWSGGSQVRACAWMT